MNKKYSRAASILSPGTPGGRKHSSIAHSSRSCYFCRRPLKEIAYFKRKEVCPDCFKMKRGQRRYKEFLRRKNNEH